MAGSTYSSNLKIELMSTGENSGTWGDITNTNMGTALEQAIVGLGNPDFIADANLTISITNTNAAQAARALVLNVTSVFGSLTATRELVVPTIQKQYIVQNNTAGGQSIIVKTSAGTGITVPNGRKAHLYVNGTNVIQMFDFVDINGGSIDGTPIGAAATSTGAFTSLTASGATTLNGAVALGDAAADLITVPGTVNSNLLFTDNSFDIGATGANRPRNLFLSGNATMAGNLSVGGTLTLTGGVNLNGNVTVGDTAADTLTINATITSNLLFTDNTYDIGASGATRPRNLFLAGNSTTGGNATVGGNVIVDGTTDSTSTTTGSLQTDGGLGVAKAVVIGTNLTVNSLINTRVPYASTSGLLVDSANMVFNGTRLTVADLADSGLTSGRVVYASSGGALVDSANLLYSGTDLTVYGITVGRGAGAVATNTAVGASALAANTTATQNTAIGNLALNANTTGGVSTAVGQRALMANTTGSRNTALGWVALLSNTTGASNTAVGISLGSNTTGSNNVSVGDQALALNTTASNNTAVGYQAGYSNITGNYHTFVGHQAGYSTTTSGDNSAFGFRALYTNTTGTLNSAIGELSLTANTTGSSNTAVGVQALQANTTASNNTAVGYQAGFSNTTGTNITLIGFQAGTASTANNVTAVGARALLTNSSGASLVAVGGDALRSNTTGPDNTSVGQGSLYSNTVGGYNTAIGSAALLSSTTASNNTAVGYQAGYSVTTGGNNTTVGYQSGDSLTTGSENTAIGVLALSVATSSIENTAVGRIALRDTTGNSNTAIGEGAGTAITTGNKNTIVGRYNGNQGGLDIRTASNYIVLSDGDGSPRGYFNSAGNWVYGTLTTNVNWPQSLSAGDVMPTIYFPQRNDGTTNTAQAGSGIGQFFADGNGAAPASVNFVRTPGTGGGQTSGAAVTFNASRNTYTPYGAYTNAEVARATGAGVISFANNGFDVAGIEFPATQKASSNANTLDDYEEGTFTNYLNFGSNTGNGTGITYSSNTAIYVKIGKVVTVRFGFILSNKGTSTGTAYLTNLPFKVESLSYADATASAGYGSMSLPASNYGVLMIGQNNNYACTICTNGSGASSALDHTNFVNVSYLIGTLVYTTLD